MKLDLINCKPDEYYMSLAIKQSIIAAGEGEVPVGAIAVLNGEVIARSHNQIEILKDATAHAEILALTQASSFIGDWRLNEVTLYVTKEPCAMCAGAMVNCKLKKVVFGIKDPKYGAAGSTSLDVTNFSGSLHRVEVVAGVMEYECLNIFQEFFREIRNRKK
jgi:tRNA(adenine34) deaminase